MSISDAINNAKQKINNVYNVLESKGATMPETKDLYNMVGTVEELSSVKELQPWRYYGEEGTITLYEYQGIYGDKLEVPVAGGMTQINNMSDWGGGLPPSTHNSNTPFFNNPNLVEVDLREVPFKNNNMYSSFSRCSYLSQVYNINTSITDMSRAFAGCAKFNQNMKIPDSVVNMTGTFTGCYLFNGSIELSNNLQDMSGIFVSCSAFDIPVSIPHSVTNMALSFQGCSKLSQNITVFSNQVGNASGCFLYTSLPKNVYIPFQYSNGVNTVTFDSFKTAGYLSSAGTSTGQNGVTVYDLNQL